MIMNVYAIYDTQAKVFSHPFFAVNDDVAKRMFAGAVNDSGTQFYQYPLAFSLFGLGTYDDAMGAFDNFATPQNLGLAATFKTSEIANAPQS